MGGVSGTGSPGGLPPPTSEPVGGTSQQPPPSGPEGGKGPEGNQQTQGNQPADGANKGESAPKGEPPPPPPSSGVDTGALIPSSAFDSTLAAQSDLTNTIMSSQADSTRSSDKDANQKQANRDRPVDREQAQSRAADNTFLMKSEDMQANQQRMFQSLMSTQQKSEAWVDKRHTTMTHDAKGQPLDSRDDPTLKQQTFRVRSQVSPGLARDKGDGQQMAFKHQMPPGYNAFMQAGPRGKQLFIYSQRPLKGEGTEGKEGEGNLAKMNAKAAKEDGGKLAGKGLLAAQKQLAKQMGLKEGLDKLKEEAEALVAEGEEEGTGAEGLEDSTDPMAALRRAMGAKASKTKGKGEGDGEVDEGMPWANFGEAIEHHTVLFAGADHAESAELVSQANFAGAIIMGAAVHIRLKGAKLNYSGTSHHGLPIPSGDESLDIGRDQVVAGFERDMGQLGVESVFVNGQRFELANPDDERKLKALVQDNPELYQMIQDIREAIQETRFYRTCLGLTEDGPGGRA